MNAHRLAAHLALEELRASIETCRMRVRSDDRPRDSQSGSQLRAADQALYRTKAAERNRVSR